MFPPCMATRPPSFGFPFEEILRYKYRQFSARQGLPSVLDQLCKLFVGSKFINERLYSQQFCYSEGVIPRDTHYECEWHEHVRANDLKIRDAILKNLIGTPYQKFYRICRKSFRISCAFYTVEEKSDRKFLGT